MPPPVVKPPAPTLRTLAITVISLHTSSFGIDLPSANSYKTRASCCLIDLSPSSAGAVRNNGRLDTASIRQPIVFKDFDAVESLQIDDEAAGCRAVVHAVTAYKSKSMSARRYAAEGRRKAYQIRRSNHTGRAQKW